MASVTTPNISSNPGPQTGDSGTTGSSGSGDGNRTAANATAPALVQSVAQGAHQTIDRLAEQVTPHVQRLQDNMAGATDMLDARADQIREMGDEWLEVLRSTVRENPLAALGAALALGVLVARLSR